MSSPEPDLIAAHRYISGIGHRLTHIARSRMVAVCGWTAAAVYDELLEDSMMVELCPRCSAIVNPEPTPPTLPPPPGAEILGRWEIELEGSPPRPNQTMRGSFSKDPAAMEKIRKMRLAMQGNQRAWKERTGWLLGDAKVPKGLGFVRVSAIFYRANPESGDDQGDVGALKAICDGIVAYGCVPDDRRAYMQVTIPESRKRSPGRRKNSVRIIIEQLARRPS